MKRVVTIVISVAIVISVSACATAKPPATNPVASCDASALPYDESNSWWATGDSIFAGVGYSWPGAPGFMNGIANKAQAGVTLVKAFTQSMVIEVVMHAICTGGVKPRNILIHAGDADLIARAANQKYDFSYYALAVYSLDDWLKSIGVERVVWTPIVPLNLNAAHVGQNPFRVQFNDWLRGSGVEIADCESMANEYGWMPTNLMIGTKLIPFDFAHFNLDGAKLHAECLVTQINDPGLTVKPLPGGQEEENQEEGDQLVT